MKMSVVYRIYRDIVIIVQILVFVMIFLAIYPVAVQDVSVEHIGATTWSFDGENVIMTIPVTIKNDGIYDINDIHFGFIVKNSTAVFLQSSEVLGNVKAHSVQVLKIRIPVNLKHLYDLEAPSFYHFYHYDTFNVSMTMSLKYMLNMVTFTTVYNALETWQPLVKRLQLYHPNTFFNKSGEIIVTVPFEIETASYLWGKAKVYGDVYGANKYIGNFSSDIELGKLYEGKLKMYLKPLNITDFLTRSQDLYLDGNLSFMGFSVPISYTYRWGAPLANLKFEVLNNGTLHYSFTDESDMDLRLYINKTYYYNGTVVQTDSEYLYVKSGEYVNRYESITVAQPVDKVVITIHDAESGFTYVEVINL